VSDTFHHLPELQLFWFGHVVFSLVPVRLLVVLLPFQAQAFLQKLSFLLHHLMLNFCH
jgi:hypothetical protein